MSSLREKERAFLAIREAIVAGAKAFLSAFKRDLAGEEMFGFLLVAEWDGSCVEAVAGTEEGLLRVVHEYGEHEGKFVDDEYIQAECIKFRWSGHEDGWYENFDPVFFSTANQLIFEAHKSDLMEGDQQLQQICIEALAELDADHVFGVGEAREKIMIGVSDVGGDHAQEDFLSWAEPVNPPIVMKRLRSELKKANELFQAESDLRRKAREA